MKQKRISRAAVMLLLLLSGAITAQSQDLKQVSYQEGGQKLNGLVTSNAGKNLPGVLILPAWKGIDNEAKQAAFNLEKQGYIAFVADIYGEGNIPKDNAAAGKIASHFISDYQAYQKRIAASLDELQKQGARKDKIAVIGYCFGGTGALETVRAGLPVQGVVSIHGGLGKASDRSDGPMQTKILVENPAEDKGVTPEIYNALIDEMNQGGADWQVITYAHCGHTFTDPVSPQYNEVMAERSWKHTLMFLEEVL